MMRRCTLSISVHCVTLGYRQGVFAYAHSKSRALSVPQLCSKQVHKAPIATSSLHSHAAAFWGPKATQRSTRARFGGVSFDVGLSRVRYIQAIHHGERHMSERFNHSRHRPPCHQPRTTSHMARLSTASATLSVQTISLLRSLALRRTPSAWTGTRWAQHCPAAPHPKER